MTSSEIELKVAINGQSQEVMRFLHCQVMTRQRHFEESPAVASLHEMSQHCNGCKPCAGVVYQIAGPTVGAFCSCHNALDPTLYPHENDSTEVAITHYDHYL